ncbi:MAG: thiamine-phosphate pyrophosphorylase [Hyphomicrobiaceae bacterium]|jgi:thiamine-phosphate pyrophosphorylase
MPLSGRLYLLFTPELCRHDPFATLDAALAAGIDLVQWRSKKPDRDGFEKTRVICRKHKVPLLVNDDVMLALRSEAAGAHVGQDDMPLDAARKLMFGRLFGVSTHDLAQIDAAVKSHANYIGFGPCYPSTTKGYDEGLGMEAVAAAVLKCNELNLPMFAIGGITPDNLPELYAQGVRRAAVSSYVLQHESPGQAVRELRVALP